jgi:hydrophobe/amphiphile efflux-1 (HAE1) family protein
MNISEIFIRRPVMTTLVMIAILFAGLFGYSVLAVSELPNVDYPTVNVQARLPGANAQTMASSVATPLEKRFSTIEGLDQMSSTSGQGQTRITLQAGPGRDIDSFTADVQAAVSATGGLPRDMPSPPIVRKANPADQPILMLRLTSTTLPISSLNELTDRILVRQLASIEGVASVDIMGEARPAVRVQVDPNAMAARGIGIDQVTNAIRAANVNQPTGELNGTTQSAIIQTEGQLADAAEFGRQIVAYNEGRPVRLADIATVIDGLEEARRYSTYNGEPSIGLAIRRQPGANTVAVVDRVLEVLPEAQAQLPPSVTMEVYFDRSQTIRENIFDVQMTLLFSAALVVAMIFVFLRKVSATLIPSVGLPIALIGAFAGMALLGFSLNNLTLMALTLSVIFIVDDAIVMLENIMRHVEAGEKPFDAALKGAREVSGTILTMTLSLAAVFVPVLFMGGILGRLLHEFAITIVIAIIVSGIVSVTLTPMMCSRIVKPAHAEKPNAFQRRSEEIFVAVQNAYERSLLWTLKRKLIVVVMFGVSLVATGALFVIMPKDFLPSEDVGTFQVTIRAPNGTSFTEMVRRQMEVEEIIRNYPNIIGNQSNVPGFGDASSNSGRFNVRLTPRHDREESVDEIMAGLRREIEKVPGVSVFLNNPPPIRIGVNQGRSQYQYTLQSADVQELYATSIRLKEALAATDGFVDVDSDLDLTTPAVNVAINRDAASALGISVQQIESALGSAFGGQQVSTIYGAYDQKAVILELLPEFQQDASALSRIYLTGADNTLVPLAAVTQVSPGSIALSENHLGQLPAVTLSFSLEPGIPLSDAVTMLREVEAQIGMPATMQTSFQGTAAAYEESMQGMGFLLIAGILVVYIVLGILYESFIHPLTILSSLPAAATGALLTLWLFDMPLTLYAYVGMIMLVGIVKKNAIIMVDFALGRQRDDGVSADAAIVEAAIVRFRPIMMTTTAALVGAIPIAIGLGASGEGRQPLGVAVVGGLFLSQFLTLYMTPVIYGYLDNFENYLSRPRKAAPVHAPAE